MTGSSQTQSQSQRSTLGDGRNPVPEFALLFQAAWLPSMCSDIACPDGGASPERETLRLCGVSKVAAIGEDYLPFFVGGGSLWVCSTSKVGSGWHELG